MRIAKFLALTIVGLVLFMLGMETLGIPKSIGMIREIIGVGLIAGGFWAWDYAWNNE